MSEKLYTLTIETKPIKSTVVLTAEGYTLYKVSGDFTKTNSQGKKEVFLDFAKSAF